MSQDKAVDKTYTIMVASKPILAVVLDLRCAVRFEGLWLLVKSENSGCQKYQDVASSEEIRVWDDGELYSCRA